MSRLFHNKINLIEKAKVQATDRLKIPRELVFGECILTLHGNHEVFIENYKGILECNDEFIWISAKELRICIEGRMLCVDYYNNDEMKVIGTINQISFMES
ncbi:MAG: YabP/YqfC family sporulation protein [Lachnospiraceae bacterium]|nr:YabP/YqfC family sporulation protein [Lachnospiraceae bacterium]